MTEPGRRGAQEPLPGTALPAGEPAPRPPRARLAAVAVALAVVVIVLAIDLPPDTLLGKADVAGYAVCHRLPERSFSLGDRPMPLCARCTGTFLGAVVGLGMMLLYGRRRASRMPPAGILLVMLTFSALWAFDGLNSYMTFFPGAPHLYEPRNWLRFTTGLGNGLTLIILVLPILNFTVWHDPVPQRVIKNVWEMLGIVAVAALSIPAVMSGLEFLVYPLALLSGAGVVMMLTLINGMMATIILGREGYARTWRHAAVPLLVGAALAILEMTGLVLVRAYLTMSMGLPF
ncbi:MAG: DUF2085 domain-containing protein [Anaerolineae bacterium]|nr:DUF2085 domain-containing protein [Anaerolineae bacterium]